jgi:hypothetical protein
MPTRFEQTADELMTMLAERRDDPEYWGPVTEVLREIVHQALASPRRLAALPPGSQLLGAWDVDELAQRLLAALPGPGDTERARPDRMFRAGEPLPAALLAALLLLGLAVSACDTGAVDTAAAGGTDAGVLVGGGGHGGSVLAVGGTRATGGAGGSAGAPSTGCTPSVGSGISAAIDASTLSAVDKQTLHACLTNLRASWCDGLTQLFATGTEEQIASTLQELVYCCNLGMPHLDREWTAAYQQLLAGALCPVVVYKGVSFPD